MAPIRRRHLLGPLAAVLMLASGWPGGNAFAQGPVGGLGPVERHQLEDRQPPEPNAPLHGTPCVNGSAAGYPCDKVDLLSVTPLAAMGAGGANDNAAEVWGWTDPMTHKEYALVGLSNGTAFVDITDGENPVYLGKLPTHSVDSLWRSLKVYGNYAFIVSEATGHGMQVFDLTQLRSVPSPPVTFSESAYYNQFGRAHTLAIDEETGFAYAVGSRQGTTTCSGGLHMIDIHNPLAPTFAGCFSADGYTHETQCAVYHGPDTRYQGHEICFACNEDTLTLVDVTNKAAPVQISRTGYTGVGYTHQGWLTEDHSRFLLDDELDESSQGHGTRTFVWDVSNLVTPSVINAFNGPTAAIDHNQYIRGDFVYQANYRRGLQVLKIDNLAAGTLTAVGYFDIYPAGDQANFNGAWMAFPYYPSGNVAVAGIEQGLIVLHPDLCTVPDAPASLAATPAGDNRIDLSWASSGPGLTYNLLRSFGSCPGGSFQTVASGLAGTSFSDTTVSGGVPYSYKVVAVDPTGQCTSIESGCASATAPGACTAGPLFAGLASAASLGQASCGVALSWPAASPFCGGPVSYSVYRSANPDFVPAPGNRIASGLTATHYDDLKVGYGRAFHYIVRAVDGANGVEDGNLSVHSVSPDGPITDGTFASGAEVGDPVLEVGTVAALEHVGWEYSGARAHLGSRSFFSSYTSGQCSALSTPLISLSPGQSPQLSFWTVYDLQAGFDGGVVELSSDGGATWIRLSLTPAYPSSFGVSSDACGFVSGTPAFTGTSLAWTMYTANLASWAGQTVKVRFRMSTDGSVEQEGWYLDDIALSHAQVPGACTPSAVFADGFETGNTSGWASTVGG